MRAYEDGGIQDREHWREVLTDPVTVRGYERLQTLLDAYGEGTARSIQPIRRSLPRTSHTLLLPGGDVGYVKIDSFPAEYEDSYATDRAALTDFYRQAADCTDLIIDLTDNSGGSEVYWQQLLAAPLTDRPPPAPTMPCWRRAATTAPISRRCSPRRSCTPSRTCRICPSWSGTESRPPPTLWRAPSLWSQRQSGPPSTAASGCWWGRRSTPASVSFAVFWLILLLFILSVPADWGYTGVVIILVFDYYYGSWKHQAFAYCMVVMLDMGVLSLLIHPFFGLFYDHVFQIDWELYAYSVEYVGAFLPLLLLSRYTGQHGTSGGFSKWFFYMFYPLHLLVLGWLRAVL